MKALFLNVIYSYIYCDVICFVGDVVNTKSKRKCEKLPKKISAKDAAVPVDPLKDVKAVEETHSAALETKPTKTLKGKNTTDKQSAKSRASAASPRITIKLVAKKKIKTIKEPQKKSAKKLKAKEEAHELPVVKDIQDDQILSAHIKVKTETFVDEKGTEDKGAGTIPTRRRGRSAVKTAEAVSQSTAKVVVEDQISREKELTDTGKDSGCVETKPNAKELKKMKAVAPRGTVAKQGTRRSNRVTNLLLKTSNDSISETECLSKTDTVLIESISKVSEKAEAKPLAVGERRRQSKRLNKNLSVPENQDTSSTESHTSAVQNSDGSPPKHEEMRVPSIKLIKIKNPKYDPQASGKSSSRKKKRRKYIWTLALVKGGGQTRESKNALKVPAETVSTAGQLPPSVTSVTKHTKGLGKKSKQEKTDSQQNVTRIEKELQNNADLEKSSSQVQAEVEPTSETPAQEMTKTDSGKVVPPLQIKKVSSPGKHKSSKPSFLIQQVSPVPEKKDVPKDPVEAPDEKSSSADAAASPKRKLRRRTSSIEPPQTKPVIQKPMTTQKRRLRNSAPEEEPPQVQVEVSSKVSTEDSTTQALPENTCHLLAVEPPQVTTVNVSEVPEKDSLKFTDSPAQLPGDVCSQEKEKKEEPQPEEAKPVPVPSRPRKPRNNKLRKKKSVQKKVVAVSPDTTVDTTPSAVDSSNVEPAQKEAAQPLAVELSQPETKECTSLEVTPVTKLDTVSVEEKHLQVKEEPDMQLIDSQPSVVSESQASDLQTLHMPAKRVKKRRKNLIGQRPKHKHRDRKGKFARLKLPKSQRISKAGNNNSNSLAALTSTPGSKLLDVQKKSKKKQSSLQFTGPKVSKSPSKIISTLVEVGLGKGTLKQEAADTPVDSGPADASTQPGKSKFVKNIKHFIMPVVSARSSRVIKTPQRFMDDAGMSVLPRRNSPKKGLQLGLPIRPVKRRDDEAERAISPIFSIDEEDILSEAQLDVDVFSAQDLDDDLDLAESLFSERKSGKNETKEPPLNNSSFKWHLPEDSSEELYTLDQTPESKCDNLFLATTVEKPPEPPLDFVDALRKKSLPKFNKQAAHLKIYQRLKKPNLGLPKSRITQEVEPVNKPAQPPVDLAEGLDDEVMSISLRQRDISTEKPKLKIEDLDSPGVVRKVCVRTTNLNTLTLHQSKEDSLAGNEPAQFVSGNTIQ